VRDSRILEKTDLAGTMEVIRKNLCCYSGDPCDCKYGVYAKKPNSQWAGEKTGCPEMRQAVAMFKEMTEEEYNEILSRILVGGTSNGQENIKT